MNPEEPKKEVKLRVTEDELQSLSRTRRRRRRGAAPLRADLTVDAAVDAPTVSIVKKQEEEAKPDAKPDAKAEAESNAKVNKVSMNVKPSTASMPANPNVKTPKVIYTKKRHVHAAPKMSIVIPTKTAFTPKELSGLAQQQKPSAPNPILRPPSQMPVRKQTPAAVLPKVPTPSKTRKFKAKRLSFTVNSKRLTSERLTAARVSKMPLSEVKQKLVAANLLKGKSKSPEPVLRGMLVNWMLLHAGA